MRQITELVRLKASLDVLPEERRTKLLEFLPQEEANFLQNIPLKAAKAPQRGSDMQSFISYTHCSWFMPFLKKLPKTDQRIYLEAFDEEQKSSLCHTLDLEKPEYEENTLLLKFLQKELVDSLVEDAFPVDVQLLPQSALHSLLDLKGSQWQEFLDLLGLYDVAAELKNILKSEQLKKLQAALSEKQVVFLTQLRQERHSLKFGEIGLSKWNGDRKRLQVVIRQRGVNRLAKVLSDGSESIMWYVKHALERSEGQLFEQLAKPMEDKKAQQILLKEVEATLSFFQDESLIAGQG